MDGFFKAFGLRKAPATTPPEDPTPNPPMTTPNARNSNPYWGSEKRAETDGAFLSQKAVDRISTVPSEGPWHSGRHNHHRRQFDAVLASLGRTPSEWAQAAQTSLELKQRTALISRRPRDPKLLPEEEELNVDAGFRPLGGDAASIRGIKPPDGDDRGDSDGSDGDDDGNVGETGGSTNPKKRKFQETKKTAKDTELYQGLIDQRPKKALKTNKFQAQTPIDLVKLNPQPIRLKYASHPLSEQADEWFIGMFRKLFTQTQSFVSTYYDVYDIDRNDFFGPWSCGVSPEFISWAETVAEPDPTRDGWDSILRNTEQRKWFIMGMLVRILQRKVFDEDLLGANKEQKELLHGLERALIAPEGFSRQALRSETVRTIIGRFPVTENFYQQVALLTAQVSLLLNPLTNYLYALAPPAGANTPDRFDLYQALHSLISDAAYLSISIRLSHTIFYFVPLTPGQTCDPDDHLNFSQISYTLSKTGIVEKHNEDLKTYKKALKRVQRKYDRLEQIGLHQTSVGQRAQAELAPVQESAPVVSGNTHRALAQICSWPVVTRFKAGSDDDDSTVPGNAYLSDKDGFRIFQICKGGGVFYYGQERKGGMGGTKTERVRLRHWVRDKVGDKKSGPGEVLKTGLKVVALGVAAGVGLAIQQKGFEEVANIDTESLGALYEAGA